ncbi:sodium:sulfate symporter [Sulfurifustis variabilis]|uniref:Sodium:sulfate symporter n=2 Tax=Sulfurifustis variabilis TaxID=1675686 RepID=A0A1B4V4E6_9GAMM|nr:sodium:sulfate symporter [Sulfurifustis variabilis]
MILVLMPPPPGVSRTLLHAAALTVFAVGLWATAAIPEEVTAIAFFLLAMLLAVAPPSVVFSGFAAQAVWLVFAGVVIGTAVKHTGLGERLARALVLRIGRSYLAVITGLVVVAMVLAFLMPSSMGRVVLLIPVVNALAAQLGFAEGSRGRIGMVMATGLACFMPAAAVLPAAVPNLVLAGAAETQYGLAFAYMEFLRLHFPIIGIGDSVLIVLLTTLIFAERPRPYAGVARAGPITPAEKRLSVVLVAALGLWATDTLHGVGPGWIGLAAATACLLPALRLLPPKVFSGQANLAPVIYVAGILGMAAVVADSGLAGWLGAALFAVVPLEAGAEARNFASLVGIASATGFVATMAGVPAVLAPLADTLADATGLPLYAVLMTQVIGYTALFIPYQSPPLVVAMQLGGVRLRDALRITLLLAALELALLTPINFLWWRWLGVFSQ